jgi:hypothetical protein
MVKIELKNRKRKTLASEIYVLTCNHCGYNYLAHDEKRKCPICEKKKKKTKYYTLDKNKTKRGNCNGYGGHPLNIVWHGMLYRCYKPEHKQYKNYGARGIFVCDEWRNSFDTFFNWSLNNGWSEGLQIDRINNNDGYCPENCRFVSREINSRNTRKMKNNKSGYTGINLNKANNTYTSIVYADGINVCLGSFNTIEEALTARNEFIQQYKLDGYIIQD